VTAAISIGLLGCDHIAERFLPIAGDYGDLFAAMLKPVGDKLTLQYFDVCNGELPTTTESCDAYLCTGSRFSAYDDYPWVQALKSFVRGLHDARKPFVGICFGHQILAEALGGKVERSGQGWGVGVHTMEILRAETWMRPALSACKLQYLHQDQVTQLPPQSTLLARSGHCRVAMFRVGERLLGIEGHPEFPAALNKAIIVDRTTLIGPERAHAALASINESTDHAVVAGWIIEFLRCRVP